MNENNNKSVVVIVSGVPNNNLAFDYKLILRVPSLANEVRLG